MGVKITNNASGTLSAAITSSATTLTLTTGQGALFPTLGVGDYSWCTLVDTSNNVEIIKVTARSTDTLTMTRGQDGTTARAFAINDRLELRPTAALFAEFASTNVVDDTTPQLGGDLDLNGNDITGTGKFVASSTSTGDYVRMYGSAGTGKWDIYGHGANLRISDNESLGAVTIDTNVGIGTTNPTSKLHVSGGAGSTIRNTATSGSSWFVGSNIDSYILHNESNTPMVFTTNGTERMRIDSAGRVTMPYQPNCSVDNSPGYTTGDLAGGTVAYDITGMYTSSNGRFTAPVSGIYMVGGTFYTNGNTTMEIFVKVNGSNRAYLNNLTSARSSFGYGVGTTVKVNANDYIQFHNNKGAIRAANTEYRYVYLIN